MAFDLLLIGYLSSLGGIWVSFGRAQRTPEPVCARIPGNFASCNPEKTLSLSNPGTYSTLLYLLSVGARNWSRPHNEGWPIVLEWYLGIREHRLSVVVVVGECGIWNPESEGNIPPPLSVGCPIDVDSTYAVEDDARRRADFGIDRSMEERLVKG
ncbi:hypothetical protein BZA05DRAFT_417595 [Tricharina praecox]|uniref:uncharacterized protein n=1 Tax=Tricharina praecox TaxID=43433 RepID=UPI0022202DCE|nr:uncharacterized protein BZA05DRAFT_417595 [Tricharina praecox]KAI5854255.1 hypothetical protein BZA05DRAFT_417595 [Tricharina praecox]